MRYETIVIQTPEYVEIEYELAGLGSRAIACLVDSVVQSFVTLAIVLAGLYLFSLVHRGNPLDLVAGILIGGAGLVGFIGYWIVLEMITNGQSIGKRMAGLRVIRDDGTPINFWDSLIRNLVRIVDMLPAYYLVGIVSIWLSTRSKRVGDYAAGTVVVKERSREVPDTVATSLQQKAPLSDASVSEALMSSIRLLPEHDAEAARAFLERRDELPQDVRDQLATRLTRTISLHLGVSAAAWPAAEEFLAEVVACHQRASRLRE